MFFGLAFPFRSIMDIFDCNDGLRRLYNTISTLSIISDKFEDRQTLTDDEEFMQRQVVRYTVQALKRWVLVIILSGQHSSFILRNILLKS